MIDPVPAIELRDLAFAYPGGRMVLSQMSLCVPKASRLAVIGPSGAGKSTLLMHLNGLLPQPAVTDLRDCTVWINGEPAITPRLRTIRQTVGFVFQDPDDQLFAATVAEDIAFGPRQLGVAKDEIARRTANALSAVGLPEAGPQHPAQLSYGERKRVALAGVLACRPEILVLDEPSSNLDPRARRQLVKILRELPATLVVATHDLDLVLDLCDRVWLLDHGRIQANDTPQRVLSDPLLMDRHGLEVPWRLRPECGPR